MRDRVGFPPMNAYLSTKRHYTGAGRGRHSYNSKATKGSKYKGLCMLFEEYINLALLTVIILYASRIMQGRGIKCIHMCANSVFRTCSNNEITDGTCIIPLYKFESHAGKFEAGSSASVHYRPGRLEAGKRSRTTQLRAHCVNVLCSE